MADRARFTGRAVLVTGGSSGIGRATARALGAEGARLMVAGRRRDRLEQVVREIESTGGEAVAVTGDVREAATCELWVRQAAGRFGGLDGLVNAAGVIGAGGITQTEPAEWDRVLDSNLRSLYLMTRTAAPQLVPRKGSIVNLSSVAGTRPYPGLLAY